MYQFLCTVPEEFMYNPVTRVYGEPHKRPEVQNATIEFMAPSEYMVRFYFYLFFPFVLFPQGSQGKKRIFFTEDASISV